MTITSKFGTFVHPDHVPQSWRNEKRGRSSLPYLAKVGLAPKIYTSLRKGIVPDTISYALSKFVSIPSVSSSPSNREDCRQAAIWLRKCLTQLGARSSLVRSALHKRAFPNSLSTQLPTGEGVNPLVLGTFTGQGTQKRPRLLFYGHYDVIPAPSEGWTSDPFTLNGRNGYLYGRGATDNKGPIMAVAFAAGELLYRRALGVDVVFLIEGEEESGSAGFEDAVRKYKVFAEICIGRW